MSLSYCAHVGWMKGPIRALLVVCPVPPAEAFHIVYYIIVYMMLLHTYGYIYISIYIYIYVYLSIYIYIYIYMNVI